MSIITRRKTLLGLSALAAPAIIRPASATLIMDDMLFGGGATDPYWNNVVLLMPYEGADAATGSPGMDDFSPAAHGTATVAAQAQIDTAQFKFGASSLILDGVGDCIKYNDSNDWNLAAGSFTLECWIRTGTIALGNYFIMGQWNVAPNLGWLLYQTSAALAWNVSTTGSNNLADIGTASILSVNTWYAVCLDYNGIKYRLYLDGVMVGSSTTTRTIFDSTLQFAIGANSGGGSAFNGWIDEVRITKGVARYASDGGYTPATVAFPLS